MIPGSVVIRAELPHTSTGKIDRQALANAVGSLREASAR
jgi:acyl-CoA synthetase (AMP-forming)/AMP-acid ligase II